MSYFVIMSQCDSAFDLKINVCYSDLYFMVQWFCLFMVKTVWWMTIIVFANESTFDLKTNVGQSDLYFMVQWFCPISWRLFGAWASYFGTVSHCDTNIDPVTNLGHSDYISWSSDFFHFHVLWGVSWMNIKQWDNESVWFTDWPQ